MGPQIACIGRGIVTLIALVWLFSTVRLHMCPQSICPGGCITTLVAFVWFFSTVRFQMCSKIPSVKGCITLHCIALLWPQNIVCLFHKDFHIYIPYNWVIIFKRLFWLIPLCEFVCALYESFLQTEDFMMRNESEIGFKTNCVNSQELFQNTKWCVRK